MKGLHVSIHAPKERLPTNHQRTRLETEVVRRVETLLDSAATSVGLVPGDYEIRNVHTEWTRVDNIKPRVGGIGWFRPSPPPSVPTCWETRTDAKTELAARRIAEKREIVRKCDASEREYREIIERLVVNRTHLRRKIAEAESEMARLTAESATGETGETGE